MLGDPLAAASSRRVRAVHPSLEHFDAWISSVGASVALNDLDGDGLANDSCLVDPRTDRVVIAPVDRPARYDTFAIAFPPSLVDPATMAPMGCTPGDLNEDGLIDLIVYFWGRTPLMLLRRPGPLGADAFVASALVDSRERWYTNAVTRADLDGDGHPDIVVANCFPDGAAILDAHGSGRGTMQASMSRARNGGGKHVCLLDRRPLRRAACAGVPAHRRRLPPETQGTWTSLSPPRIRTATCARALFRQRLSGRTSCWRNDSTPGRLEFHLPRGGAHWDPRHRRCSVAIRSWAWASTLPTSTTTACRISFVSNIAGEAAGGEPPVVRQHGCGGDMRDGFARIGSGARTSACPRSSWGWDVKLDDFDNDGADRSDPGHGVHPRRGVSMAGAAIELATANDEVLASPRSWPRFRPGADLSGHGHNPFFAQFADGRFYDIAAEIGLGEESVSRGVAVADVDGDGRLDFAVANQWQESSFFRNRAPHPGAFVGLRLLRPLDPSARFGVEDRLAGADLRGTPAIGAVARVQTPEGVWLSREVDGGNGHSGRAPRPALRRRRRSRRDATAGRPGVARQ